MLKIRTFILKKEDFILILGKKENLKILVKDRGTGISPNVLEKLFKSMVTNKGTLGTGLGLYISNAVIRGKFNGKMWGENREGGGSIFGISIPIELVHIRKIERVKEDNQDEKKQDKIADSNIYFDSRR